MALIGDIRKRSGLLIIIIGVALAAFVLGDLFSGGPRQRSFNIGEVEGEEIPILAFNQRLEENMNMRRQNLGRENLTLQEQYNVRQSTWDEIIREMLLEKEYDALGLNISTEELDDLVRGPNPHNFIRQSFSDPQTGAFDPAAVDNFLMNFDQVEPEMRQRYLFIEQSIKDDQLSNKHQNLLSQAYYVPEVLAKKDFYAKNRQASILTLAVRYQTIPDDEVEISEKEVKRYYEDNKFRYKQEASRAIDYVIFDIQPSDEDRRKIEDDFNKLYEELKQVRDVPLFVNAVSDTRYDSSWFKRGELPVNIEEELFDAPVGTIVSPYVEDGKHIMARLLDTDVRPDSLKASHILITYQGTRVNPDITRTPEQAQNKADSLLRVINRDRSKFAELAMSFSDDPSAAQNEGDLGWFKDGDMVYPFNQAVIENRVGQVVMVESQFGFHIIEITGKTQPEKKIRVAVIDRFIEPSTRTIQSTYVNASQFASTNRNASAFENAVVEEGLSKRTATDIKPMDNNIPGISSPRELIRWIYNESTKVGDVSPAFDVDGAFVVATLKDIKEEGTMPFENAKSMIEPLVRREKKAEIIRNRMAEAANETDDIRVIASKLETSVDTLQNILYNAVNLPNFGREPKVIGKIFAMEENQISQPIAGDLAVYMVKVLEFSVTEPDPESLAGIRRVLNNSFRSRVTREAYQAIENNSRIEDNRMMFY
jgi:peptidyl-prolyl cis-trans isomerase D